MTSPGPEAHLRFDVWRSGIGQPANVQITDTRTGRVVTATEPTEMQARARCAEQMAAGPEPMLSEWLMERLAEDEQMARAASSENMYFDLIGGSREEEEFIDCFGPARVLTEAAARRAIVELHESGGPADRYCLECGDVSVTSPCETLRCLALPYASHPGYREQWRP